MSLADIEDTSKVWGSANNGYFCVQYQLRNIFWKYLHYLEKVRCFVSSIECMYYLEIFSLFVFHVKIFCVSNIGIVHYFEIPTILWGGELYHPLLSGTMSIGMVDHNFLVFSTLHNAMMITTI